MIYASCLLSHPHPKKHSHLIEYTLLGIIIVLAIIFRFTNIATVPAGYHKTEAQNYEFIQRTIHTQDMSVVYVSDNNSHEGLFVNLSSFLTELFDSGPLTMRIVSAITGVLAVIGLYKLTKLLFSWQIATLASFMMAVSFWHVLFSRLGLRVGFGVALAIWALYYLWRGKQSSNIWYFALSGLLLSLSIMTYSAVSILLVVIAITLAIYWTAISKDLDKPKYLSTREQIIKGFVALFLIILILNIPLVIFYVSNPELILDKFNDSPFGVVNAHSNSLRSRFVSSFEMFVSSGDTYWLHNISGEAMLLWPVSAMFLLGLLHTFVKWAKKYHEHGHFSTVQTFLLSWFFIGLIPTIWGGGIPNAQTALIVAPVVFILAGQGLWWFYEFIKNWHQTRDKHEVAVHGHHMSEGTLLGIVTIAIVFLALTVVSYNKYFDKWANAPELVNVFTENISK